MPSINKKKQPRSIQKLPHIALHRIFDIVSDSYAVINENYEIIDFSKPLSDCFKGFITIKRMENLLKLLDDNKEVVSDGSTFKKYNDRAKLTKETVSYEKHLVFGRTEKYLTVELTPIYSEGDYLGTIILLRDITEVRKNLISIQEKQKELSKIERLSSLGQLIGGVTHNFKTPIMAISGTASAIEDLADEYANSLEDTEVVIEDYIEIASEIEKWADSIEPNCVYMSEVVEAVKEQALNIDFKSEELFSIKEAINKSVNLINPVMERRNCSITISIELSEDIRLKGDINALVQVINNLIENASESYDDRGGPIEIAAKIEKDMAVISVSDKGCGIQEDLHGKLFKQMVTTKGKKGTGIGLFISYSTVKGMFNGYIWYETLLNRGTTFYVSVPYIINKTTY